MHFAVDFRFKKDFVLHRLRLRLCPCCLRVYLYAWTNEVQISFVPENAQPELYWTTV